MDGQVNVCGDRGSGYLCAPVEHSSTVGGGRILGEGVWAMCNGMPRAARSLSGTEWPLSAQLTTGPSDTGSL